jgi:hypothetical protein
MGTATGTITSTAAPAPYPTTSPLGACASVSQLAAAATVKTPIVPAKLAYDCITSVPFNSTAATELLDSIRPYLDWQSTVDYIREPPAEYAEKIQEPYDFYGEFNRIYGKAKSDGYANEYEFGFDLYEAVSGFSPAAQDLSWAKKSAGSYYLRTPTHSDEKMPLGVVSSKRRVSLMLMYLLTYDLETESNLVY